MIAVIFEFEPKPGKEQSYFMLAEKLAPIVNEAVGLISIERFKSCSIEGKYLSLSFWENETAVKEWRNTFAHREAQDTARANIFNDYRIRVAYTQRDYGMCHRSQSPLDSQLLYKQ